MPATNVPLVLPSTAGGRLLHLGFGADVYLASADGTPSVAVDATAQEAATVAWSRDGAAL